MSYEIELKLAVPESAWRAVPRHPRLASAEKLPTRKLVNIYYDTPELDLRRKGVALRLRKQGRQWLQTIKCAGEVAGGLSNRPEWEQPYRGNAFDFGPIEDHELRNWLSRTKLSRRLRPAFETTFSRQTWRIANSDRSIILVMFDRGQIQAAGRAQPISEIELELAQGDVGELFDLARELAVSVPLRPEPRSKAERGYRLVEPPLLAPRKAGRSPLHSGQSALEAFSAIGLACIAHLQANENGVIESTDPEFIHQMRVAIRRLRSAMRLFRPLVSDTLLGDVPQRLKILGANLGAARDWDVLITELLRPVTQAFPGEARFDRLISVAAAHRGEARNTVIAALRDAAFGRLMIDVLALLHRPGLGTGPETTPSLAEFALGQLVDLHRRVGKAADRAAGLDIKDLHRLRIAIKRLRYALEFFTPIYPTKPIKRDLQRLTRLQDDLGLINDLANAGPRLTLCADEDITLREAVAMAGGWYGPRYQALMAKLPNDLLALGRHRFVWEREN
jgi:inorganic triphosphatase YgiF